MPVLSNSAGILSMPEALPLGSSLITTDTPRSMSSIKDSSASVSCRASCCWMGYLALALELSLCNSAVLVRSQDLAIFLRASVSARAPALRRTRLIMCHMGAVFPACAGSNELVLLKSPSPVSLRVILMRNVLAATRLPGLGCRCQDTWPTKHPRRQGTHASLPAHTRTWLRSAFRGRSTCFPTAIPPWARLAHPTEITHRPCAPASPTSPPACSRSIYLEREAPHEAFPVVPAPHAGPWAASCLQEAWVSTTPLCQAPRQAVFCNKVTSSEVLAATICAQLSGIAPKSRRAAQPSLHQAGPLGSVKALASQNPAAENGRPRH